MTTCLAFSFWNFFKNTWASSNRFLNRSKPTPKLLFTAFHRVPFTLFFPIFFEILPSSSNYNCLLPSSFPRNIQLLSTFSSNLFSNQSPFSRIIKKKKEKIFPIKKKKKTKVVEFYPRGHCRFSRNYIWSPSRRLFGVVSSHDAFDLFQCTRPDACVSVEPDEESVIIVTSMR